MDGSVKPGTRSTRGASMSAWSTHAAIANSVSEIGQAAPLAM